MYRYVLLIMSRIHISRAAYSHSFVHAAIIIILGPVITYLYTYVHTVCLVLNHGKMLQLDGSCSWHKLVAFDGNVN